MKKYILPVFLLAALTLPTSSWAAYSAYVQSIHADVYSAANTTSQKTGSLSKGDKLSVLGESGSFFQVEIKGKTGYVYKFLISKTPVSSSEMLYSRLQSFFSKVDSITEKSRRRPSSYTATAAARGLREKREHFAERYKSDYRALESFEAIQISDNEALDFIRTGVANDTMD